MNNNTVRIGFVARLSLGGLTLGLVLTVGRVWQLKVDPPSGLGQVHGARDARSDEHRFRGTVFDAVGRTLAIDRPAWRLAIDPAYYFEHGYNRLLRMHGQDNVPSATWKFDSAMDSIAGPESMAREHLRLIRFRRLAESLHAWVGMDINDTASRLSRSQQHQRYLVLNRILEPWQVEAIRTKPGWNRLGLRLDPRTVREYLGPKSLAMIVGKVRDNGQGGSGLEERRDEFLQSVTGELLTRRTSQGSVISIPGGSYKPGSDGADFTLTIDSHIQLLAEERLAKQLEDFNARSGRCLIINPNTGDILAMVDLIRDRAPLSDGFEEAIQGDPLRASEPSLARNRNLVDAFEPGSTFKPFVWSGAVELGVGTSRSIPRNAAGKVMVNLKSVRVPGRRVSVKDAGRSPYHGPHDSIEMILVHSLNTGMLEMVRPLSKVELRSIVRRFGFGSRTGCGLGGEAEHPGQVTTASKWSFANTSVSVSFGHEVAVTTLQMARAFSAFCTDGTMPQLRIARPTNLQDGAAAVLRTRAISPKVAMRTRNALRRVVTEGTLSRHARSEHYSMFGKSGTADLPNPRGGYFKDRHTANVIAGAPLNAPQVVVYCVIDDPDKSIGHYGGMVAGPVVKDLIDATLRYAGVRADLGVEQGVQSKSLAGR